MNSKANKSQSSMALAAVAFQDHILKNMTIGNKVDRKRFTVPNKTKKKKIEAVVDTGLKKKQQAIPKEKEKEYVIDAKPQAPTLAQKLGLIEYETNYLTEKDWEQVKGKSNEREDHKQGCPICKENFDCEREQVLLSCSHVFHRQCLTAFERFSGKQCCPMCRKEKYQKRVIYEGARYHRHFSATKIQATWKMYKVRRWYRKLRESIPPKDTVLRKKFFEDKLSELTRNVVNEIDSRATNSLLNEIDENLSQSRSIFQQFDRAVYGATDEEWNIIQVKALERKETDCPICLTKLCDKKTLLLSCSHVFHFTCLGAFESFSDGQKNCPVCRSSYKKRPFYN
ncbi:DgyrCDS13938 [Dimorphilus gyrociliatus]|uniref:DgyrCDS13938 n=1 Tax=Dimorphilus gyrociliatus TaxID=2664684 RepID=A0A7I8WCA5_9ANNE|nr:DgyrCDS13938 [Dimorphilus gyrociliatus]